MSPQIDYRRWLMTGFSARRRRNSAYSLRAFARDLGTTATTLSEVLNRKRGLSDVLATRFAKGLGLSDSEATLFRALVKAEHARGRAERAQAQKEIVAWQEGGGALVGGEYREMTSDFFDVVADWQHFAALELFETKGFSGEATEVAARLNLSEVEARATLARLEKVGLLERVGERLRPSEDFTASTSGIPSEAIRRNHRQILGKALDALETQSVEERDFGQITLAIDPADLPKAKELLKKFRRELGETLGLGPQKSRVYCLAMQLFALDGAASNSSTDERKPV